MKRFILALLVAIMGLSVFSQQVPREMVELLKHTFSTYAREQSRQAEIHNRLITDVTERKQAEVSLARRVSLTAAAQPTATKPPAASAVPKSNLRIVRRTRAGYEGAGGASTAECPPQRPWRRGVVRRPREPIVRAMSASVSRLR